MSKYLQITDVDGILRLVLDELSDKLQISKVHIVEKLFLEKLKKECPDEKIITLLENKLREREFKVHSRIVRQEAHYIYMLSNIQKKIFNMCWQNVPNLSVLRHAKSCFILKGKIPDEILDEQKKEWDRFEKINEDDINLIKEFCRNCKERMIKERFAYDGTQELLTFVEKSKSKLIKDGKFDLIDLKKKNEKIKEEIQKNKKIVEEMIKDE